MESSLQEQADLFEEEQQIDLEAEGEEEENDLKDLKAGKKVKKIGVIEISYGNWGTDIPERGIKFGEQYTSFHFNGYQEGSASGYTDEDIKNEGGEVAIIQKLKDRYNHNTKVEYVFRIEDKRKKVAQTSLFENVTRESIINSTPISELKPKVVTSKGIFTKDSWFFDFRMWKKPYDLDNEIAEILLGHSNNSGNACFQCRNCGWTKEQIIEYWKPLMNEGVKRVADNWLNDLKDNKYLKTYGLENYKQVYSHYELQMKYLVEIGIETKIISYEEVLKLAEQKNLEDLDKQIKETQNKLVELIKQKRELKNVKA